MSNFTIVSHSVTLMTGPPPQRKLRNQRNRNPDFGVPQQNILFISQIELNN